MGVGGQRHAPSALSLGKRPVTHCTGGWVGLGVVLDGCGKSAPLSYEFQNLYPPAHSETSYRLWQPSCICVINSNRKIYYFFGRY
jgi:hypothetical protein